MPPVTEGRLRMAGMLVRVWQQGPVNIEPTLVAAADPESLLPAPSSNIKLL